MIDILIEIKTYDALSSADIIIWTVFDEHFCGFRYQLCFRRFPQESNLRANLPDYHVMFLLQ